MAWQGVVCWGVDKEGKRKLGKGRLAQNFGQHQLLSQFFLVQPFHRPKAVLYKVLFTCLPISFVFHQNKNKAQGATENVLGKNVREDPFALTPPTFGHCQNRIWPTHPHLTGHSGAGPDWALWDQFEKICKITVVVVNKFPKPSTLLNLPPTGHAGGVKILCWTSARPVGPHARWVGGFPLGYN